MHVRVLSAIFSEEAPHLKLWIGSDMFGEPSNLCDDAPSTNHLLMQRSERLIDHLQLFDECLLCSDLLRRHDGRKTMRYFAQREMAEARDTFMS